MTEQATSKHRLPSTAWWVLWFLIGGVAQAVLDTDNQGFAAGLAVQGIAAAMAGLLVFAGRRLGVLRPRVSREG